MKRQVIGKVSAFRWHESSAPAMRELPVVMQCRKLMAHIIKLRKELARWEKKHNKVNDRKRKAILAASHTFILKLAIAMQSNPNGLDDLERFSDCLKANPFVG